MGQIEIVSRAAQKEAAGRIWPPGRRLHTPVLQNKTKEPIGKFLIPFSIDTLDSLMYVLQTAITIN